jgi:hypothetical protein
MAKNLPPPNGPDADAVTAVASRDEQSPLANPRNMQSRAQYSMCAHCLLFLQGQRLSSWCFCYVSEVGCVSLRLIYY